MSEQIIGVATPQVNAREKVLGSAVYAGDMKMPGMLHVAVARSPYAHAEIVSIDTDEAKALPGVHLVLTGEDTPLTLSGVIKKEHRILATGKVRFVGEEVVAVLAEDEEIARNAVDLVQVEYEPLPALLDPEEAMTSSDISVHEDRKSGDHNNIAREMHVERGDVDAAFGQAAAIYEASYDVHSQYPGYLEPMATVAWMGGDGRLTVWTPTHGPFQARQRYAEALEMPQSNVRVVQAMTGGGFGAKAVEECNSLIAAFMASKTNRPVRFLNSRLEDFQGARSSLPERIHLKMGVDAEGMIVAKEARLIGDCGAYMGLAAEVLHVSVMRSDNMHRLQNVRSDASLVYTNNPPRGAFRGFGGAQMAFAVNSHMTVLAEMIGMDPLEIQKRNATRTGDTTVHGWEIGSGALPECLDWVGDKINWDEKRRRPKDSGTRRRGVGVGAGIHVSGNGAMGWDGATIILKMNNDGRVILITGEADVGQGSTTMLSQVCAQELGIPLSHVTTLAPDTDVAPFGLGSIASRVTVVAGNAALRASRECKEKLLALAAEHFEVSEDQLTMDNGEVFVTSEGSNRPITFGELARMHIFRVGGEGLQVTASFDSKPKVDPKTLYGNASAAYSFAAQTVEVEVDTETGQIVILDTCLADDCGKALNPLAVHGQSVGAAAQAIGWTLYEYFELQDGGLMNGNFADYTMPTADSLPDIQTGLIESNDPNGPFGAKGASETAIVPGASAIANAIYDAVGVRINSLPITPEKLLAGLRAKEEGVADA